jgi:hypothetical protein
LKFVELIFKTGTCPMLAAKHGQINDQPPYCALLAYADLGGPGLSAFFLK